jgi:hypothetical protein
MNDKAPSLLKVWMQASLPRVAMLEKIQEMEQLGFLVFGSQIRWHHKVLVQARVDPMLPAAMRVKIQGQVHLVSQISGMHHHQQIYSKKRRAGKGKCQQNHAHPQNHHKPFLTRHLLNQQGHSKHPTSHL